MRAKHFLELYEAQQELFEVEMSPSNLKKLAAAVPGAMVGMEFEMVVPDVDAGSDDDFEAEPDYDYDERAIDIDDIVEFFGRSDDYMGQVNDPSELSALREELDEKFYEWQFEKIDELWNSDDGKKFFAKWCHENVDPDDVSEKVEKSEDLFGNKVPDKSDWEEFINAEWEENFGSDNYQNACDEFRQEKQDDGDFDEGEFLRDIGIEYMSDVNRRIRAVDLGWPYYTQPEYGTGGQAIEAIGDDFSTAIGKTVYSSSEYHGAHRAPNAYSL